MEQYAVIDNCRIEGIEASVAKFQHILANIKKKPYDVLDHRKLDFDQDFNEFRRSINDLETHLRGFMNTSFERMKSTLHALKLLERFNNLNIPSLGVDEKYQTLFKLFGNDIETIKKLYQKCRNDPPVPRDVPPIAGKIAWARQLSRKLQEPMDIFMTRPLAMKGEEAKKVILKYNQTMRVLVEFEMLYHQAWMQSIETCQEVLHVPLLVRHPETRELLVNLDPVIFQVIQEASYIKKLGLEVPYTANTIAYKEEKLKANQAQLQVNCT